MLQVRTTSTRPLDTIGNAYTDTAAINLQTVPALPASRCASGFLPALALACLLCCCHNLFPLRSAWLAGSSVFSASWVWRLLCLPFVRVCCAPLGCALNKPPVPLALIRVVLSFAQCVVYDNVGPTVTTNTAGASPTNVSPVTFTIVFSESVNYDVNAFDLTGSTACVGGVATCLSVTGVSPASPSTTVTVSVTGMTLSGNGGRSLCSPFALQTGGACSGMLSFARDAAPCRA